MSLSMSHEQIKDLTALVRGTNTLEFPKNLQDFLEQRLPFSTFLIVIFASDHAPLPVYQWIPDSNLDVIFRTQYLDGAFLLDPFYRLCQGSLDDNAHRLRDNAPDRFFSSEYYRQYYAATGLIDEVGLFARLSDGHAGHLSISRSKADCTFDRKELLYLRLLAPMLSELLRQHCEWFYKSRPQSSPEEGRRPLEKIIYDFALTLGTKGLTPREAEIVSLILQGHSSSSASLILEISRETIKVHRRNIHRKLKISSQAELFATFSQALSERSRNEH